ARGGGRAAHLGVEAEGLALKRPGLRAGDPEVAEVGLQAALEGGARAAIGPFQTPRAVEFPGAEVDQVAELAAEAGEVEGGGRADPAIDVAGRLGPEEGGFEPQPLDEGPAFADGQVSREGGRVAEGEGSIPVVGDQIRDPRGDLPRLRIGFVS